MNKLYQKIYKFIGPIWAAIFYAIVGYSIIYIGYGVYQACCVG